MNHPADFLESDKVVNADFICRHIDGDFRHVSCPCECAVSVTLIPLVIPLDSRRRFILAKRSQRAKLCRVRRTSGGEFCGRIAGEEKAAVNQRLLERDTRGFDELAHDHASSRRNGWSTIRNIRRVRLRDFNVVIIETECVGCDLGQDCLRALSDFSARD